MSGRRCILFHFYIKPQPRLILLVDSVVVSYSISTSNHNSGVGGVAGAVLYLIPFLHQTTTHSMLPQKIAVLYLIPFLHQTTTLLRRHNCQGLLYLIPFLHQTTTLLEYTNVNYRCILFHFYIKPQLIARCIKFRAVVSYSISTSNHNYSCCANCCFQLYLIPFLHQTTTINLLSLNCPSCILFHFYIKPQLFFLAPIKTLVVSYSISTSNHNYFRCE